MVKSLCVAAQLSSAKTKKLAKELQELHNAAFQAVKDNKEVLARRLLEVSSFQPSSLQLLYLACMHGCSCKVGMPICSALLMLLAVHISSSHSPHFSECEVLSMAGMLTAFRALPLLANVHESNVWFAGQDANLRGAFFCRSQVKCQFCACQQACSLHRSGPNPLYPPDCWSKACTSVTSSI